MEELVKKRRITLIIIVILLLGSFLTTILYIKYGTERIMSKGTPKVEEKEKVPKEEIKDPEETPKEEMTLDDRIKEISNNFSKYFPITDISKIHNQDLLIYGLSKVGWEEYITEIEIENAVKKIFGNKIKGKHENIECPTSDPEPLYLYRNGVYTPNPKHGEHGGSGRPDVYPFEVNVTEKDNVITANYKLLYSNYCSDTCIINSYFKSYQDSINNTNPVLSSNDNQGLLLTDELYKSVESKLPTTTFIFEKGNDTYNLVSVTIK